MSAPAFKTRAEQRVEWIEGLGRPLSDRESDELRRSMHAVYCRNLKLARLLKEANEPALAEHVADNAAILERVLREARA